MTSTRLSISLTALATLAFFACAPTHTDEAPRAPGVNGTPEQPEGFDDDIRLDDAEDLDPADGIVEVEIEARVAPIAILDGVTTDAWTYNGGVPGPTIRARAGDHVVVRFHNALPEPTTIHWHGLRVDAEMDGVAPVVPSGSDFVYELDVPDAGTFWYHPHVDSSAQLGRGLYGAFIVDGDDVASEAAFGTDVILVVSDISLNDDGTLRPADESGWFGDFFGREGNVALVNGRVLPSLRAFAGVPQRWRVVNASRSRYQRFSLPEQSFTQIAVDGGLLDRPIEDAEFLLPPGARADVVFAARTPTEDIVVKNLGFDRVRSGAPPRQHELFHVVVDARDAMPQPPLPEMLRTIAELDLAGVREQTVTFNTVVRDDGNSATAINGELGHDAPPFTAETNSVEVWTIENTTTLDHPFHLHGFFFQLLSTDGEPPSRRGWLDTINVAPRSVVRIAPVFDDRAGAWMFHCHILDHAEMGMMRTLLVGEASDEHDH
jgi:FtsP/CotA-like multicopper oxidase with cupredoxin domain